MRTVKSPRIQVKIIRLFPRLPKEPKEPKEPFKESWKWTHYNYLCTLRKFGFDFPSTFGWLTLGETFLGRSAVRPHGNR